jgi:hypothetical protein
VVRAGECCAPGAGLDAEGTCCSGQLDSCGICGGATRYTDVQGVCCPGLLDGQGRCCQGEVDECGMCGGRNECVTSVRFCNCGDVVTACKRECVQVYAGACKSVCCKQ